ncbi:hypothetical protein M6D93_04495 [Jatrophihabitans telluris]|uniref:Lycopene cyclase domain-containing protein n=1 Tax=Jatrophihabitans telluris TaxID=2038343 RepID=A0ABY4R281_9ACTN|nr:hypothetical protein [Jatrophihabitans telluris]UQX89266.1 hypothetical protein M6D93_04495 [Jatrophihabitans telluris]
MTAWLAPLVLLVLVVATDLWVYFDAKRCVASGSPVFIKIGNLTIETPVAWLAACLVLWIFFFPTYILSRSRG